jgi:ABC-type polysaccharide/polyol phosphate transport system ATPase subunit
MTVLEVQGVHKSFRVPDVRRTTVRDHALAFFRPRTFRRLQVLEDVTFALRPGESLGVMGRNGCGKSTLLKIIAGIYRPDRGNVVCHTPITPILELGVGWNLELDAIDNIHLVGAVMGMTLPEIRAATEGILAFAGLRPFARQRLRYFSTGMAARLAYAIAFHAVREVLILDEILAVGDAEFSDRCYRRYRELHNAGHAILLVSHNPSDISKLCQRALLLDQGRIVREGTGAEVAAAYLDLLRARPEKGAGDP